MQKYQLLKFLLLGVVLLSIISIYANDPHREAERTQQRQEEDREDLYYGQRRLEEQRQERLRREQQDEERRWERAHGH